MNQEERERAMFGMTLAEFKAGSRLTDWKEPRSVLLVSMSLQSDVQEMMTYDNTREEARRALNLSKALIAEVIDVLAKKDA